MKEKIRLYISEELLDGEPIQDEEELLLSGLIDSIGLMRLVGYIEELNNVKVPPQDLIVENFDSLASICTYLQGISTQ